MPTSPRNEDLSSKASAEGEDKPLFEVVDRRKGAHVDLSREEPPAPPRVEPEEPTEEPTAGPGPAAQSPPPPPAAEPVAEEDRERLSPEEEAQVREELLEALYPDNVYTVFDTTVALLANLAWQKMGLTANPKTQKTEKDLEQAQAAIDVVSFIVEQMAPKVDEVERRELANLVANLKINFVQQSQ